jgi:protein TonB
MVCRAATGQLAPDLGVPLSTSDGLSGACLQTRQAQLSVDTEFDPRVDPSVSRSLGIRSILIVPVFDTNGGDPQFAGVLEVFSTFPAAFSHADQKLLEGFAEECSRIRHAAAELSQRPPVAPLPSPEFAPPEFVPFASLPAHRPSYKAWSFLLGALAILASLGVSFLIGSRIGWLRLNSSQAQNSQSMPPKLDTQPTKPAPKPKPMVAKSKPSAPALSPANEDELVVYEKGKIIFRMNRGPDTTEQMKARPSTTKADSTGQGSDAIVEASSTTKIAQPQSVWLAPAQAETRLLSRTEPEYPADALAAHRAGNVVLEIQVAEDGSVSSSRTLSGDPLLAAAAAAAVRNWRYQPYRPHDRPAQFQTDVTLSFVLPH